SSSTREQLIMEHLPQVRLIARRIHDRLPGSFSLEDLVSSGTVGLIAAIDRYDGDQGVKLRTYAEYKIRGAILDGLREMDWAPRRQRRRARSIQQAAAKIEQRTQTTPTVEEIAVELGITTSECRDWVNNSHCLAFTSLDSKTSDEDGNDNTRQFACTEEDSLPSQIFERAELRGLLASAIEHMPKQEKMVLSLCYHKELTLREIAKVMDLHESRISQLKMQALARLKVLFEKNWPKKGSVTPARVN
ncbi:MAG: FliA/WhiG family RNA polymerase sigma factor, partial [Bryobacteraceae bacterium]|nr:FliA/WhiG family RNA polymerase sigma factor [Bryobacteraceae bacterium]